ncbi:DNA-3-methyladenine glycosylase [Clostridium sp. D2Q-11]|uniref:Putative 3-methyladenine DNA glycosylase n=1 Tax=Anaeromonas frigoriresistens TaxID=2683708 RepID=A0A942Z9M4_9FIRM|nr:DNA-3-methyladenine glycosylase [Anaeromonas frigoriresistens]
MKLNRSFYKKNALDLGKDLLGKYLVFNVHNNRLVVKIVEVEAYMGIKDKASHTYKGKKTPRTEAMFMSGGHAYVYLIYGIYNCLNIVASEKDNPQGVLIRGVEPIEGENIMSLNRFNKPFSELKKSKIPNLTNGPGKLTQALGITRELNGEDLTGNKLYICSGNEENIDIIESKRIGIDYSEEAKEFLWRFYIKDNKYVSYI